ncbi:MAG: AraC family transcriptional regulator [Eubacteriales bacterium]|nr:AraC family transcriptional regulator [Eubacteriales bacterium]
MYMDFCGIEECLPDHSFGPYVREEFVLHVVLDGKGIFQCGKNCFEIDANSIFLIYPGEETFYKADHDKPWYYCWIGFHGVSAERVMQQIGFTKDHPVLPFTNGDSVMKTIHAALEMEADILTEAFFRRACINQIIGLLLIGSPHRRPIDILPDQDVSYTAYAARYLQRHFAERIRVNELAAKIGISRSYLVRLFRDHYGISPQEYLIRLRMIHATECLLLTGDSIGNIAMESGYPDPLAFSKIFKQRFGVSPSVYREQNRQISEKGIPAQPVLPDLDLPENIRSGGGTGQKQPFSPAADLPEGTGSGSLE